VGQEVRQKMKRGAEYELGPFPGQEIPIAELTRTPVGVGHLRDGKDGHGSAEATAPLIYIVERASRRVEDLVDRVLPS